MRVTRNNSTDKETTLDGVVGPACGPDGQLVIVAMTPAVLRLAQVARAIRQAHNVPNGKPPPSRGTSRPGG